MNAFGASSLFTSARFCRIRTSFHISCMHSYIMLFLIRTVDHNKWWPIESNHENNARIRAAIMHTLNGASVQNGEKKNGRREKKEYQNKFDGVADAVRAFAYVRSVYTGERERGNDIEYCSLHNRHPIWLANYFCPLQFIIYFNFNYYFFFSNKTRHIKLNTPSHLCAVCWWRVCV